MASTAVTGLIPAFFSMAGDGNVYYSGRLLWFGFLGVYGVVIYVVQMPWAAINNDFWCHGNATLLCQMECFEKHFNMAVVGLWYFFLFIFLANFFLMEFFIVQILTRQNNMKAIETISEVELGSMVGIQEATSLPRKNLLNIYMEKMLLFLYLFYFFSQLIFQTTFLWILVYRHLPLVNGSLIDCKTDTCQNPYLCLVRGTLEKRMSIYTLITLSTIIIVFCLAFFLYSAYHYLVKLGVLQSQFHRTWKN
ncbi:uncharacterized protein LOC111721094 [Sarcophilus harrisii]|uniref:Connexin N-terminal domain-containing protein n=1 Tax=Sarcophilus harrisii TaxID=9305 RepID=A0A7N4NVA4_SARHA|nr:uncharacterized protein LOC111721094 [Sarcophilus harrisii]XP_023360407.1 uncharacterized protein LOC111721094 [Sarcophilus harrisii]